LARRVQILEQVAQQPVRRVQQRPPRLLAAALPQPLEVGEHAQRLLRPVRLLRPLLDAVEQTPARRDVPEDRRRVGEEGLQELARLARREPVPGEVVAPVLLAEQTPHPP
jgi:hypothetical protein